MKRIPLLLLVLTSTFIFAQDIELETYATGFSQPVDLKNAGDDRLFVVEKNGRIRIIDGSGATLPTPFLDIVGQTSSGSEQGLLSVAFHPDYANNGKFYVNYTIPNGNTRVSEFTVSAGDPNVADASSEVTIIEFSQPFSNHNGGCIQFGPDGFLYIASGDGGSGGDPGNRAQNVELLLGKLLRIDIDNPIPGGTNYSIPADNPFAGNPSNAQEIWAYGLRNPWKFSFDSATDDLWIADVGQNAIEEINKVGSDEAGLNYGWVCFEGTQTFATPPAAATCPPPSPVTDPVAEYPHSQGQSITGGYVYNGTMQPSLQGFYFFADFVSGIIGTVDENDNLNNLGSFGGNWATFGVDQNDELFIVNFNGTISRIVEPKTAGVDENNLSSLRLYPNPASNKFTVDIENNLLASYEVLDMKGSVIFSENEINNKQHEVDVTSLTNGIYLLRVTTTNNQITTKKLVVE